MQQQTNELLVCGVNLDFNKTVSDIALVQHFYALNPFAYIQANPRICHSADGVCLFIDPDIRFSLNV